MNGFISNRTQSSVEHQGNRLFRKTRASSIIAIVLAIYTPCLSGVGLPQKGQRTFHSWKTFESEKGLCVDHHFLKQIPSTYALDINTDSSSRIYHLRHHVCTCRGKVNSLPTNSRNGKGPLSLLIVYFFNGSPTYPLRQYTDSPAQNE